MSEPLAGRVVIVTRPAGQAERFIALVEERGATTLAFPTIAIEPLALAPGIREALTGRSFDWLIYTSSNAVAHSPYVRGGGARVAAIGRATARALEAAGARVDATPSAGADTESLLALPAFSDLAGQAVLIVKGVGGRDALRSGLEQRGATVTSAEVYRRVPVVHGPGAVAALERAASREGTVIAVTSVEVLDGLLALAATSGAMRLTDSCLLVPGERVAAAARSRAWRGPLVVARSAEDDAMLAALLAATAPAGPAGPA